MTSFSKPIYKLLNYFYLLDYYYEVRKFNKSSRKEKTAFINKRIRNFVKCAYLNTHYYHSLFKEHQIDYDNIRKIEDLKKIPITDKITFRKNQQLFYNVNCKQTYTFTTSGSTGIPVKIIYDIKSLLIYLAISQRHREVTKKINKGNGKKIFIVHTVPDTTAYTIEEYIHDILFLPKLIRSKYPYYNIHLPMEELIDIIKRERPLIVSTYGSFISLIARYLREHDLKISNPRLFIYSSDNCSKQDIKFLLDMGIKTISTYTCVESLCLAYQDVPSGNFIIYENAANLWNDESENIILTNLFNDGTILLNYRVGDRGKILYDSETDNYVIKDLEGSVSDYIVLKDGGRISHAMIDDFFWIEGIIQYQIIQKNFSKFVIRIVVERNFDSIKNVIESRFRELLNYGTQIQFENVTEIKREKSGKFKPIICEIKKNK